MDQHGISRSEQRRELHFGNRLITCFAERPASVWDMIARAEQRNPTGEALVDGEDRWTWTELLGDVAKVSACLAANGVGPGDRVAIMVGNRSAFVIALYALIRLGAIAVPLSTRYQMPEVAHAIADCGAILLVHDAALADRIPGPDAVPALRLALSVDSDEWSGALTASPLSPVKPAAAVHEDDTAVILYTSGTTGRPKGAMLTHLGLVNSSLVYRNWFGLTKADRSLAAVPLAHVTGMVANLLALAASAGTIVILPVFKPSAFLELAAKERITHTLIVPTMYNLCLLQPDFGDYDLSCWRIGAFGGAPMPEPVIADLAIRLPNLRLMNAYGATETSSPATIMPAEMTVSHLWSVGQAVPNCDILVLDENGREAAAGEPGELWISGPSIVKGYWNNPAATAEAFVAGFWRSGDIGFKDADGFIRIFDRIKDLINRGGLKVYSAEVENALASHPAVLECAVVGKPCPVLGERVHAFVSVAAEVSDAALKTFLADKISDYKIPESFSIATSLLPRNANGKILKRDLRAALLRDTDAQPDLAP